MTKQSLEIITQYIIGSLILVIVGLFFLFYASYINNEKRNKDIIELHSIELDSVHSTLKYVIENQNKILDNQDSIKKLQKLK